MHIRPEGPDDAAVIRTLTTEAFADAPYASGTEGAIIDALRRSDALTLSLVAELHDEILGHVAFSPVTVDGAACGWYGLGPVAIRADYQRRGFGQRLIWRGLEDLETHGARGCVVLGDPRYYARFGFKPDPRLRLPGAPAEYFQVRAFAEPMPEGDVAFHPGFDPR